MAKYVIDIQRPVNTHSKFNYTRKGIIHKSFYENLYDHPNRVALLYSKTLYGDDRYYLDDDYLKTTTQYRKIGPSNFSVLFGRDDNSNILSFPPAYQRYVI